MKKLYTLQSVTNYQKALTRLQKSIRSGRFKSYTQQKKQQIWNRLCRYARQVGFKINTSLAAACIAAGLSFVTPATAQTFTVQTGAANPFDGVITGTYAVPTFVDIDGDGDKDAFVGNYDGTVSYYKNTGTATAPIFTVQTGAANPLNSVDVGYNAVPTFVDIDGDGDKDAFVGEFYGAVKYYKNTGTATAPVFTAQTGTANPFNKVDVGYFAAPSFADIDGDGDSDAFIGEAYGTISYYKNTGTSAAPVFALQTGAANPFNGVTTGYVPIPTFVDLDGDGDKDVFFGGNDGTVSYYKNTGTAAAPVFTVQTGANNPFDGVDVGDYAALAFVDVDGDGDLDAFIGGEDGTISYYQNTSILPLHLLSFSGSHQNGYNELEWQTAGEINTQQFEIEQSKDGRSFTTIATVKATGTGSNSYNSRDYALYSSKIFYRLKMVDIDGRFTYSSVIWIDSKAAGVTIYPNPAINVVNINIGNAELLNTGAGIYDANGRLLKTVLITTNQQAVNVQSLAKGVYRIRFADGTSQRFIKE